MFGKTIHRAVCASKVGNGVFFTDLRGFPDIEGACVFVHSLDIKEEMSIAGLVVPGLFHKSNYREYLTIVYSIR